MKEKKIMLPTMAEQRGSLMKLQCDFLILMYSIIV